MKIRQAKLEDKEQLLKLVKGLYSRSAPKMIEEWKRYYSRMINGNLSETLIVEDDKNIVAYICFSYRKNSIFIGDLYVLPRHRGKGIAMKLLRKVESIKKKQKLKNLLVTVRKKDRAARKLYNKLGFKILEAKNEYSWRLVK